MFGFFLSPLLKGLSHRGIWQVSAHASGVFGNTFFAYVEGLTYYEQVVKVLRRDSKQI